MIDRVSIALAAVMLFVSALSLITAQHRARSQFVDLERARQAGLQLDIELERLTIDLGRLSQPVHIEQQARRLGLRTVDPAQTVYLNVPAAVAQAPLAPAKKR